MTLINFIKTTLRESLNENYDNKILVYHGTNGDFDKFEEDFQNSKTGFGDFGKGFYFTKSKNVAKYYTMKLAEDRAIVTTYVSITNPFIIDIDGEIFSPETKERYSKLRRYVEYYQREIINSYIGEDIPFAYKKINKELGDDSFSEILQNNNYDGVIVNRTLSGRKIEGAEIVVFNTSQIGELEIERV